MSEVNFGRVVSLMNIRADGRTFRLGLEAIEPRTGRLVEAPSTDYEGDGSAFEPGDVLFGKLRPYLAKVWLADRAGAAVGDFHVYRASKAVTPRYLRYLLLGRNFLDPVISSAFGAKMPRADWSFIRNVKVYVPSLAEQGAIADYLDRETAKVDALIAEQEGLVEVLRERRSALRVNIALRSLTEVEESAESGLPWAGRIPSHWRVVPLTAVARLESGHTPSRTREDWWQDCYIPWVSLHDVGKMRGIKFIRDTEQHLSDAGIANSSARLLPAKTVVLSRDATVGRTAIMADAMATSQHFAAWVCGPRLEPEYLWVLFSDAMQPFFDSFQNGSTIRTIGMGDLKAFRIPLPPLEEQRRIAEHLEAQTKRIDALIAEAEGIVAVSKERRSALITASVTGQIDVRREVA
ncbi:restriction endonuclease subunit S [Nocardioides sp. C4-1]|uniref:restriction endonuclease subunit S n=1 Tax=Nocardioides sp. C4-1 TaxID=3151851 RepID=UPI0032658F87